MNSFSQYIDPLLAWLQLHPHWALLFTFIVSFAESLAIVGSIIPGSLTMTAIGILAGSGVMRVDLTLMAATMGAIVGDSGSYLIGYTFSDRIVHFWPFSRYPNLLTYGKDYFNRHGGKSVLVGRFVGPLRSIIPVIAGMVHMSQWRFFLANFLSAIAWAFLYVLPGVLIGAASSELSPESAARLFALVLVFIGLIWLLSVIIKWILIRVNHMLRVNLHDFWSWSSRHPYLASIVKRLTPLDETYYYQTAGLVLALLICTLFFVAINLFVIGYAHTKLDQPIHLFLQSLRTNPLDAIFLVIQNIINPINLAVLALYVFFLTLWCKQGRQACYWLSLHLSSTLLIIILQLIIYSPHPEGLLNSEGGNSFPAWQISLATAQYSMLMFYTNFFYKSTATRLLTSLGIIILILAGFSTVYLGDYWVTDVLAAYFTGLIISISHWLMYRRLKKGTAICSSCIPLVLILMLGTVFYSLFYFDQQIKNHQPYNAQYVFTTDVWWNQTRPVLPIYRSNRIGKPSAFFNLQYAGSISHLEAELSRNGWRKQNDSLFYQLLKRMSASASSPQMPLMAQLYLNRKPVLVMTYKPQARKPTQILRIWRSNYHLKDLRQPIWLGSIELHLPAKYAARYVNQHLNNFTLDYLSKALKNFPQRKIWLNTQMHANWKIVNSPFLLIIKETPERLPEPSR